MVRVWVNILQELFDAINLEVCAWFIRGETNGHHQVSELVLVKYAISIHIHFLIHGDKVCEELFVLLQLEVEDTFEEDCELELVGFHIVLIVVDHGAGHGFASVCLMCGIASHQVAT